MIVLAVLFGASVGTAPAWAFPDVSADHPYKEAIDELSSRGIIARYADGRFGPSDLVLR